MSVFYIISLLSAYSIAVAAIIGLVRFKKIHESYQPFLIICMAGLLNEFLSHIALRLFNNTAVNHNLYGLVEAILYLQLFKGWGHFRKNRNSYVFTLSFLVLVWITDNLVFHPFTTINDLFWVVYSFCLVFLAIDEINLIVMRRRDPLLKYPRFLICTGIVIFYSYMATIEVFYVFKLNFSNSFYSNIYFILDWVNLFTNLVFALAVIWIPEKQKFILHF